MANPNVFGAYLQPPKSVLDYEAQMDEAEGRRGRNALQALMMSQTQAQMAERERQQRRAMEVDSALRGAYGQSGGDKNKLAALLRASPVPELQAAADAIEKAARDAAKAEADRRKVEAETADKQRGTRVSNEQEALQKILSAGTREDMLAILNSESALPEMERTRLAQAIPADPAAFAQWLPQFRQFVGLRLAKPEAVLGATRPEYVDAGGQRVNVNPLAPGAAPIPATFKPGEEESLAIRRMQANAAISQAKAANDANIIAREQQQILRGQQIAKGEDEARARTEKRSASVDTAENTLRVLDMATEHPGRESYTGKSSVARLELVPGSETANYDALHKQITGQAFLEAFATLKGGGQITEVEGKKATQAIARLERAQSDDAYLEALGELRELAAKGYARAAGREYARPPKKPAGGDGWGIVKAR